MKAYRQSLRCYMYLRERGHCHLLRYEDLLERPHEKMAELAEFLGRDISKDAVDRAMRANSQSGTLLERASAQGRARWEAMQDETYRSWQSSGMAELCDRIIGS